MSRRKLFEDYEEEFGEIEGISGKEFDMAGNKDKIEVECITCGNVFFSKKEVIAARINRGSEMKCTSCVNTENIYKRYS